MECVFGIDVSKENANVAVLVDNVVIKQFKIGLYRLGFSPQFTIQVQHPDD
ncbi:hypothetical protein ABC627_13875 [Lacticaseibacillus paracasei]|uniref:hypothetical protein n=1 Tax=Lacticaseibacillus paracasei TaxID=1597 RepID=UPI0031DC0D89